MDGWSGYPLDCYDYKSTCGANKQKKNLINQQKYEMATIAYHRAKMKLHN